MIKLKNMGFDKFSFSVVLQAVFLAVTPFLFFLSLSLEHAFFTTAALAIVWLMQVFYLIYFIRKTNRDIALFVESLLYNDLTITFNEEKASGIYKKLYQSLNRTTQELKKAKRDKEIEHQYFMHTVRHIDIGIVSFDENGKVQLYNKAFINTFEIHAIRNIDALNCIEKGLSDKLMTMKPGKTAMFKFINHGEIQQLLLKATVFMHEGKKIKTISVQDIKTEIEESEMEAWRKLIRTLNHEIINSVSPISMLTKSLINMYETDESQLTANEIDEETIENTLLALKTIQKRSTGLKKFVESYRSITKTPDMKISTFDIAGLFQHLNVLFKDDINEKNIDFKIHIEPENLTLTGDERLIEQVLINLIKNAIAALESTEMPKIALEAEQTESKIFIRVADNGKGMDEEVQENIFTPFFTTKSDGNGIGLSFSRQIMRLHKGTISVRSTPGIETVFTLKF